MQGTLVPSHVSVLMSRITMLPHQSLGTLGKEDEESATEGKIQPVHMEDFTAIPSIPSVPTITSVTCVTTVCEYADATNAALNDKSTPAQITAADLGTMPDVAAVSQVSSLHCADLSSIRTHKNELPQDSRLCGAEVERYSPEGIAYCAEHFPGEDVPRPTSMTHEQFMSVALRMAAVFPGGCTVHVDPSGYTLHEQVRRREQESRVAVGNMTLWLKSRGLYDRKSTESRESGLPPTFTFRSTSAILPLRPCKFTSSLNALILGTLAILARGIGGAMTATKLCGINLFYSKINARIHIAKLSSIGALLPVVMEKLLLSSVVLERVKYFRRRERGLFSQERVLRTSFRRSES
jgi:hypothetical protein